MTYVDDFMIAWTPKKVEVNKHPDTTGWSDKFDYTAGACFFAWQEFGDIEKQQNLIEYALIIEKDGVNVDDIKSEFRKIQIWNGDMESVFMTRLNYIKSCIQYPPQMWKREML